VRGDVVVIYCHSKVFMVQATRLSNLICNLGDFMKRVCTVKDRRAVNRTWEYFRDRSKNKDEIAKFTRKIDFRYESTYSPSEAGLGRQNGTPTAQLSGLERMLTILDKRLVGTDFHSLVDKVNEWRQGQ